MTRRRPVFISIMLGLVLIGCVSKSDLDLKTVKVSSEDIYCVFDPSCTVTITDSSTNPIPMTAEGTGFLESRTFAGKSGTPASGLYGYEYRINLEKTVETTVHVEEFGDVKYMPCLRSMTFEFGPLIDTLDYDGDGEAGDLAYVVASGGPGGISIGSMQRWSNRVTLNFDSPVCVGGPGGQGDSTYIFGLVSARPPRSVTATIKETAGLTAASPKLKKKLNYKVLVHAPQAGTGE